jgi:Cu+-exporting ATPase
MGELGAPVDALLAHARAHEDKGRTVSWLAVRSDAGLRVEGLLAFGDRVKPTAALAVRRLEEMGVRSLMLTGDNKGSARAVAEALGIRDYVAEVLPADKANVVAETMKSGRKVAMVGDGINDAPALAAADVGIAMASGTDVAMHTAGITLMRGDPVLVADAIDISHRTYRKIRQNLGWAFFYNVVGIPLAAFGLLNPVVAGAAMALSSVSVVSNALLLRGWKPRATAQEVAGPAAGGAIEFNVTNGAGEAPSTGGKTMYELTVEGMSCGHCVGRVTKSVQGVDEQARVTVDLPTKKVRIDSDADLDKIAAAIDEAGYPVTERKAA